MSALRTLMPGFVGLDLPDWVARRLREGMGGVCLFVDNVDNPEQLRALTDAIYEANPHAVVSIDEEGGDVSRLYQHSGSPFPGNAVLGRLDDADTSFRVGEQVGWELRRVGVSLTLAPDVDVNSNPNNPVIGVRSFGTDPEQVGVHGAAWTRGVQSTGVAANAKHFPGHGDTAQDSHVDLPSIDADPATLRARELPPFAAAIAAGIDTIMSSHIMVPSLDPAVPATFSKPILQDLLRDEMGFDGVIVSDALDMKGASGEVGIARAAVLAIDGGCDLLCIGTKNTDAQMGEIVAAIDAAVSSGELASDRLADAARRVESLGSTLANRRSALQPPVDLELGKVPGLTTEVVASAFAVTDAARELIEDPRPVAWLQLQPAFNIAVGPAPWGPFATGRVEASAVGSSMNAATLVDRVPEGALPIVVGKDNHRHEWIRDAIDALRARGDVIVVDMGWPDESLAYADIATFGASRLVGDALLDLIGQ
ncbi:glycoside hydrolase family 3 protein [Demequina aurantiaca]|uniref:glycoside hydrolase family 3 protein n=1 Tax=Demequina aurantiaca TaxID=676200 RepID=UPI000781370A|nr:glycoside hydrolase family 3 protein [Demequina aurantiaca]